MLFLNSGLILYYKWNFNGFQEGEVGLEHPPKTTTDEMLVTSNRLGPAVLVWSSFTLLAFLSNGCLAFRLVNRHLSTVQLGFIFLSRGGSVCMSPPAAVHSAALKQ